MSNLKQALQVYWKINWLRRSLKTLIVIALVLTLLPVAIQFGLTHQLKKMGAHRASIENIDLNLFSGRLTIASLEFSRGSEKAARLGHLLLDVDVQQLFSGIVSISELTINGLDAQVVRHKSGQVSLNGIEVFEIPEQTVTKESPPEGKHQFDFAVEQFVLTESQLGYQETDLVQQLHIRTIAVERIRSWESQIPALISSDIDLNDATIALKAEALLFAKTRKLSGHVNVAKLKVGDYAKFYRQHIERLAANLNLDTRFDLTLGETVNARLDSNITIDKLHADYRHLQQRIERLNWRGETRFSATDGLIVRGDLAITNNLTRDSQEQYNLAGFDSLKLNGLHHTQKSTKLDKLSFESLIMVSGAASQPEGHKRFVLLDGLAIDKLKFEAQASTLGIDQVTLNGPHASLLLDKERQLVHLGPLLRTIEAFNNTPARATEAEAPREAATTGLALTIDRLLLASPGMLQIEDNAVTPVYKSNLRLERLDISNISNTGSATIDVGLKLGEYTGIDIKGEGLLFDPRESLQLQAKITQLDLPPITPYTSNTMGYGMKSGTIDSDLQIKLLNHEIDSLVNLKIDTIEIVETHAETAQQISSASGMSIDLALSSLKDSDNVITLKLPIKGNIDKPDFDLSHIINHAVGKAMQSATLAYLKHTLQPFGSLITLYNLAQAAANHISLPAVVFRVNSLELEEQQDELITKVAKMLSERPALKIKACGIATDADRKAIEAELLRVEEARRAKEREKNKPGKDAKAENETKEHRAVNIEIPAETVLRKAREMADQRAARVKQLILQQGALEPARILNCLSTVKSGETAKPSVELTI